MAGGHVIWLGLVLLATALGHPTPGCPSSCDQYSDFDAQYPDDDQGYQNNGYGTIPMQRSSASQSMYADDRGFLSGLFGNQQMPSSASQSIWPEDQGFLSGLFGNQQMPSSASQSIWPEDQGYPSSGQQLSQRGAFNQMNWPDEQNSDWGSPCGCDAPVQRAPASSPTCRGAIYTPPPPPQPCQTRPIVRQPCQQNIRPANVINRPPVWVHPPPINIPQPEPIRIQPNPVQPPMPEAIIVRPPQICIPSPPVLIFKPDPPSVFNTIGRAVAQCYRAMLPPSDPFSRILPSPPPSPCLSRTVVGPPQYLDVPRPTYTGSTASAPVNPCGSVTPNLQYLDMDESPCSREY